VRWWIRRRRRFVLGESRRRYAREVDALTAIDGLADADRRLLRRVLRAYAVQRAMFVGSMWTVGYHVLRAVTAIVCLTVPAVLVVRGLDGDAKLAGLATYAIVGGVVAVAYGIHQGRAAWAHLAVAAGGAPCSWPGPPRPCCAVPCGAG
jgi:hypothetical protein